MNASATPIKTAVVTGRHPFDVPALHAMFRSLPGVDFYLQHLEDFVTDVGNARSRYDVVVFYNFHQDTPGGEQAWWERNTRSALEQLGETRQGILVLHHALLAYKQWPLWSDLCGLYSRASGFHAGQSLRVRVAEPAHPVTQGVREFDLVDETYTTAGACPEDGNTILLATDHPASMKTLAWARQYRNAPVLCWQSGHGEPAFANPAYREIMSRALHWLASRTL
jgi:uncharacterized protein